MKKHLLTVMAICVGSLLASAQPRSASQPQKLIECKSGLMAPVWSPTGDKIAVTTDNYTGILIANADGTALTQLTADRGAGYKMAWSNDGKQIMGRSMTTDGHSLKRAMKAWNVADGKASAIKTSKAVPSWNSTNSVYDIMANDAAGATSAIAALSSYAGKMVINPTLSPDGTKVAFQIPGNGIMVINADGSALKQVCQGSHPQWLPDNKSLIFTRVKDDGQRFISSDIYAVNIENGNESLLTGSTDLIPLTPAVSPDGKKVAFENAIDASIYVINLKY